MVSMRPTRGSHCAPHPESLRRRHSWRLQRWTHEKPDVYGVLRRRLVRPNAGEVRRHWSLPWKKRETEKKMTVR
ncbi:Os12g0117350 [Oryza sativa Japonica Group]|uniref:Os12g0117350 protein n=1 Tax=Oryza sativa subsp. japonica TaxID=39947 RepID=A0A0N7KTH3_ORYSJ|nr:hypothetical protein EE612_057422 [Oryza sativa]BAT15618.1 Os12g0117350 [Oryza sativa Japonica Group]